jgi:hypothetical protein
VPSEPYGPELYVTFNRPAIYLGTPAHTAESVYGMVQQFATAAKLPVIYRQNRHYLPLFASIANFRHF